MRSYYDVLQVSPDASQEEIREAFLRRARQVHPDRFEAGTEAYEEARRTMVLVNQAYRVLKDPVQRAEYDLENDFEGESKSKGDSTTESSEADRVSNKVCEIDFLDLPGRVQKELLWMQRNGKGDYFSVRLESITSSYWFCISVVIAWLWFLLASSKGERWTTPGALLLAAVGAFLGFAVARSLVKIIDWHRSNLRSNFFLTPLFFIKTDHDVITFAPLSALRDIMSNHHRSNGEYTHTDVKLVFPNRVIKFQLDSQGQCQQFAETLERFDRKARAAVVDHDWDYFHEHGLFVDVDTSAELGETTLGATGKSWVAGSVVSLMVLSVLVFGYRNSQHPWFYHDSPTKTASTGRNASDVARQRSKPVQRTRPKQRPYLVPVTPPKEDSAFDWKGSVVKAVPRPVKEKRPTPTALQLPKSGKLTLHKTGDIRAPFEIKTRESGSHYFVKLVDATTEDDVATVFVRDGASVDVEVPLGTYELRYASGKTWYGENYLFGPRTSYAKANSIFNFSRDGNRLSGYTVTLYTVTYGNLSTTPIDEEEW